MMTAGEAFQQWLDETMFLGQETRLEFIKKSGANFSDIKWAFIMGYCRGQDSMSKFVTGKLDEMESK